MQRQNGISLVDILIVLGILFFAVLILAPMEGRVKKYPSGLSVERI